MGNITSALKGGLVMLTLLFCLGADTHEHYVPVPCPLSVLRIVDWGKCHVAEDAWDCPGAHIQFRTDCLAKKTTGKVELPLNVDRPTAVLEEDK